MYVCKVDSFTLTETWRELQANGACTGIYKCCSPRDSIRHHVRRIGTPLGGDVGVITRGSLGYAATESNTDLFESVTIPSYSATIP